MKKITQNFILGAILTPMILMIMGCPGGGSSATCVSTNTDFQQIYTNALSSGLQNQTTMDLDVHEYTFTLTSAKTLCQIGYQSLPTTSSFMYKFTLTDSVTGAVTQLGAYSFSSTGTSYVSVPTVNLAANTKYTISRSQPNGTLSETLGRLATSNAANVSFPRSFGIMSISSSKFYGRGGPIANFGLPYIDIVFQ